MSVILAGSAPVYAAGRSGVNSAETGADSMMTDVASAVSGADSTMTDVGSAVTEKTAERAPDGTPAETADEKAGPDTVTSGSNDPDTGKSDGEKPDGGTGEDGKPDGESEDSEEPDSETGDEDKPDGGIGEDGKPDSESEDSEETDKESGDEEESDGKTGDGEETDTETEPPLMGADAEIEEGWYRIATAVDPSFVLDVEGGSTEIRANIQIYPNNGTAAQIFYVERDGDGLYTMRNRKSSHYLNVAHGSTERGANIWQYRDDGTDAMKFRITESDKEGCVRIFSVLSGLPMDVKDGKAVRKANVQLWRDNGTDAQLWQFQKVPEKEAASVKTGYYSLVNVLSDPYVFDVKTAGTANGTGMQIHKSNGTAAQVFYIEALDDGTWTIMACCSGKYLTTKNGSVDAGTPVIQMERDDSEALKWKIFNVGGFYQFAPAAEENRVLGVRGGNSSDSLDAVLETSDESSDQLWQLTSVAEPQVRPQNGLYTVTVAGQTRYVLDVDNGSTATANIRIHHSNGTDAQKYLFMTNSDGTFTIVNIGSFMAVDVKSAGTADGTNVQQHTANNDSNAQKWTVKGCPGRYRIVSACGNKVLSTDGAVGENTNIVIRSDSGADGQRFSLDAVTTFVSPLNKQIYRITTSKDTSKAIDVPDAGYAEGLLMRIHTSNYTDAQKWQFLSTGDGYYVIQNVKNGLCLTAKAYGGSTWGSAKGTTVIQYNEIEGNSYKKYQKWKPVPAGDGGYYLQNSANGLYLDVKGGSTAQDTPLQVYPLNSTPAQKFYLNRVSTSCYLRWHDYATDSKGVRHWLEGTFWDDPKVSDVDFLAAAIYTEGGSQGLAGMMMIGYSMLNRSSIQDMRYTIYEYGQYQICRDGALTRLLTAIKNNQTAPYSNLDAARSAARNCASGSPIRLTSSAVMTYPGGQRTLAAGTYIGRGDFSVYNGFMTPGAWSRHGFSTANKHTITYLGHIYYVTAEVW